MVSDGAVDQVHHVAFRKKDGGTVVVLTNSGAAVEVALAGALTGNVQLPANSIATVVA